MVGKVHALSNSIKKGFLKSNVGGAKLIEDIGIKNDAHSGKWHRRVCLLQVESIEKMRKTLSNLCAGVFVENITTQNFDLLSLNMGDKIKISSEAKLEITQIGKVYHSIYAIFYRAGDCVIPGKEIFANALKPGKINLNYNISVL